MVSVLVSILVSIACGHVFVPFYAHLFCSRPSFSSAVHSELTHSLTHSLFAVFYIQVTPQAQLANQGQQIMHAAYAPPPAPAPAPVRAPARAPAPAPAPVKQEKPQSQVVLVTIPKGVKSGGDFVVTHNGVDYTITCPAGVSEGQDIEVEL